MSSDLSSASMADVVLTAVLETGHVFPCQKGKSGQMKQIGSANSVSERTMRKKNSPKENLSFPTGFHQNGLSVEMAAHECLFFYLDRQTIKWKLSGKPGVAFCIVLLEML